jgi:acyl-coenzyme A thioesterase PaaI-like protein
MDMHNDVPLQDRVSEDAPIRHCYGCGADNSRGLKIKSRLDGDEGICRWTPREDHCGYPGYLNGGIACTLIDCHSMWTAFAVECRDQGVSMNDPNPPTGWTRAMNVEFLKPTPLGRELVLRARVVDKGSKSRTIDCSIYADEQECVRAKVTAVMTRG